MPYRRTYRRKYPARRKYARRPTNVRAIARVEAKKVVSKAIETKMHDVNQTTVPIDYTIGYVSSMTSALTRGTAENQYLGDKITPVGLSVRMQFTRVDATQMIRCIVIQNRAGGVPLLSTLLQSVGNITAPLSPYDVDYDNTYRVLYDQVWSMDSIRGTTMIKKLKLNYRRLRPIWFNGADGELERGGIYLMFISDSAVSSHPTVDFRARLYYKDA